MENIAPVKKEMTTSEMLDECIYMLKKFMEKTDKEKRERNRAYLNLVTYANCLYELSL